VTTVWGVHKLGNVHEWSSDAHLPIMYLIATNEGAPSRMTSIISKSSASTSPISLAAPCHGGGDVRSAT